MKKVLIADDEFLVRLGLRTTISWEENGFIIVGEAKNGKEAIELFEKHDPDILLTDIRMPVMSGLELIQELKARKKSLKSVILSHYDDFNYAREALKLGASEYILKTDLSSETLFEVLKKLSNEIDTEGTAFLGKPVEAAVVETISDEGRRQEFLKALVTGGFKAAKDVMAYLSSYKGIFKYNSFVAIFGIIEDINSTNINKDRELFVRTVSNISNQVFDGKSLLHSLYMEKDYFTFLINFETMSNLKNLHDYLLSFKKQIKQFLGVELSLGISETGKLEKDLIELLWQAKEAQQYCFFEESGIVEFNRNMMIKEGACPRINLEVLKNYVKTFELKQIYSYIEVVFAELLEIKRIDFVKDVFMDFLSYARIIATELKLKNSPALNETKFSYSNFDKLYTAGAVKKYLIDIYHSIVDYVSNSKPDSYSYIISKSISYIKSNYQKNIALSDVAEQVEISSSYLSLLFKQETGINFSAFLTNYRIEMSKKLLVDTNMKIYEIAEQVGFENPYYFSKVFREITGMTCKIFKKNHFLGESYDEEFS